MQAANDQPNRQVFIMSEGQFNTLADAMAPVLMVPDPKTNRFPPSQQDNANEAWENLAIKMGFDPSTVKPALGDNKLMFTAVVKDYDNDTA